MAAEVFLAAGVCDARLPSRVYLAVKADCWNADFWWMNCMLLAVNNNPAVSSSGTHEAAALEAGIPNRR